MNKFKYNTYEKRTSILNDGGGGGGGNNSGSITGNDCDDGGCDDEQSQFYLFVYVNCNHAKVLTSSILILRIFFFSLIMFAYE